jgi:excisionase family DNA binding protein
MSRLQLLIPDDFVDAIVAAVIAKLPKATTDDTPAVVTVPALLSVRTVAGLLDCSPGTVRRRIRDGDLAAVTDHGRLAIRGDELRAYIDALERVGGTRARRRPSRPRTEGEFDFLR